MSKIVFTILLVTVFGLTNSFSQSVEKTETVLSSAGSEQDITYTHGKMHQHPDAIVKAQLVKKESAAHGKIHAHPHTAQSDIATQIDAQEMAVTHSKTHAHPHHTKTAQTDGAVSHIHFVRIHD